MVDVPRGSGEWIRTHRNLQRVIALRNPALGGRLERHSGVGWRSCATGWEEIQPDMGRQWRGTALPVIRKGMGPLAAENELIAPLFHFHNNGRPIGNGWTSPPNGANWGTDYLSRAATAKSNMYDNAPQETRYIYTDYDSSGERLNGEHEYSVIFPKNELPPVNGFWSLTLYNKEHLFAPNQLNRYSLGTKSKQLKFGTDGSLTLYVQNSSPGAEKESNWLPAPKDDFSLYIRAYWPKSPITDGSWIPPAVRRVR